MSDKRYTFEEFAEIVAQLRGEEGCPWDKKQTHASLNPYLLEETKEAIEGVRILEETGDWDNLCEELGDVLLLILLHCQIAKEEGLFTVADVVQEAAEKMVRRHPHVFSRNEEGKYPAWEEIKAQEKAMKSKRKAKKLLADCAERGSLENP